MRTTASPTLDVRAARSLLDELRQLERAELEHRQQRRSDALERAREAVRRLGDIGSPGGILDRAAEELGRSSAFERVLISRIDGGVLIPHSLWSAGGGASDVVLERLRAAQIRLDYPLIEAEVVGRQEATVVDVMASGPRTPQALRDAFGWDRYVVVALTLRGGTVGLLHAEGDEVDPVAREAAAIYAEGLAGCFELAALRATLRRHREELQSAVRWMSAHLDRPNGSAGSERRVADPSTDPLTPREIEVVRLLTQGHTNRSIARTLVISEGTAKYHVKNILRKLRATSRADAVARYLRSTA